MKNGCKPFQSKILDEIKIDPYFENRLHDIIFAETKLRVLLNRGHCIEETLSLIQELRHYIIYLYQHIEQLEKDKQYLLKERLKHKNIITKI